MTTATSIRECQHIGCGQELKPQQRRFCCRAHMGRTPDGAMNLGIARSTFHGTQFHAPATLDTATCAHYWMIEIPTGPKSNGICQLCGVSKVFKNYPVDPDFRDWVKRA